MEKQQFSHEDLRALFEEAKASGRVHNQKEFADLVGINRGSFSSLLSGALPLTDSTFRRIQDALVARGVLHAENATISGSNIQSPNAVVSQEADAALLAEMKAQREMYTEHMRMFFKQIEQLTSAVSALASRN